MFIIRPVFKEHEKQGRTLTAAFDAVVLAATLAECKIPFVVEDAEGRVVGGKRWLARWALEPAPGPRGNNRRIANVN